MNVLRALGPFAGILLFSAWSPHAWSKPYNFPGPPVAPGAGVGLPLPSEVPGKEFSQLPDRDATGAADPQQIVSWDGIGGTADAANYFGSEPQVPSTFEIDAIANHNDALFDPLLADNATLIFSVGNGVSPTASGEITTSGGFVIGRSGDLSYESAVTGQTGIWATAAEIDAMNPPVDVDGVELWGPEQPGFNANRYSLRGDADNGFVLGFGISVYCPGCGSLGNAYIVQAGVRDDVAELLGQPEDFGLESEDIDLDAMIIGDTGDETSIAVHGEDAYIFSIRQLAIPGKPGEFYATGSEIFVKRTDGTREFLFHGGHLWDRDWALANMKFGQRQMDINALEAVSVPEPATAVLVLAAQLAALGCVSRVRRD